MLQMVSFLNLFLPTLNMHQDLSCDCPVGTTPLSIEFWFTCHTPHDSTCPFTESNQDPFASAGRDEELSQFLVAIHMQDPSGSTCDTVPFPEAQRCGKPPLTLLVSQLGTTKTDGCFTKDWYCMIWGGTPILRNTKLRIRKFPEHGTRSITIQL